LFQLRSVFQLVSAKLLAKGLHQPKWPLEIASSRIQESIAESKAKNLTALLLLNYILVEANWQHKFPVHRLAPRYFNTFDGRRVKVDSMKTLDTFKYYCHYKMQYKLLEVPLESPDDQQPLDMWIFLPIEGQTLAEMVKRLTFTNILHASKRLKAKKVCVQLPKFTINYEFDARDVLESLGMEDLFATRTLNVTVGAHEALGDFVQIAKIEVTENGLVNSNHRSNVVSKGKWITI
jgi:serine protease inhibitor